MNKTMHALQFSNVDTLTALRTILALYWGDDGESDGDLKGTLMRALSLSADFLAGKTDDFDEHDCWLFYDALASYPAKDEVLATLARQAYVRMG